MLYIAYYTKPDDARLSSPAANEKIKSISKALGENGVSVEILSTCTVASKGRFIRGRKFKVFDNVVCRQYSLFNTKFGPFRRLQYIWASLRIFFTLLFRVKRGEDVLVYHAIERIPPVKLAKKIKKFRLVLEVEEIYAKTLKLRKKEEKRELQIIELADAFIFPTKILNDKVNTKNKPYCIIHGTYEARPILEKPLADKIHVLYAGTLAPTKGAFMAVECARFLSENYHIHILGYGDKSLVENIENKINEIKRQNKCEISYDGYIKGESLDRLMQKCAIGLCPQNQDALYNDVAFPSKILTYMANGLRVVTSKFPAIETSAVNEYMYYYDNQSAESVASAIRSVKLDDNYDSRQVLSNLRDEFKKDVKKVLNKKAND